MTVAKGSSRPALCSMDWEDGKRLRGGIGKNGDPAEMGGGPCRRVLGSEVGLGGGRTVEALSKGVNRESSSSAELDGQVQEVQGQKSKDML